MTDNNVIAKSMDIRLDAIVQELPPHPLFVEGIRRAPKRQLTLSRADMVLAMKNALRYVPEK